MRLVVGISLGILQRLDVGDRELHVAVEIADVLGSELGPDLLTLRAKC